MCDLFPKPPSKSGSDEKINESINNSFREQLFDADKRLWELKMWLQKYYTTAVSLFSHLEILSLKFSSLLSAVKNAA